MSTPNDPIPDATVRAVEPDAVFDLDGTSTAQWGQITAPTRQELDPLPAVYARAGEIETGDWRGDLDQAEQYARRILAAVAYQRAEHERQRAAELNASARGDAATHDWCETNTDGIACRTCWCRVYSERFLMSGAVPVCGARCRQSWHEIGSAAGRLSAGACIFCKTVYPPEAGQANGEPGRDRWAGRWDLTAEDMGRGGSW